MKRLVLVALSLLTGLAASWGMSAAAAEAINSADAQEIRAVVQSQLDAFAADDAEKAFALSTSSTREQLGNPESFLRLIKEQYTPIYRHRFAIFSMPEIIDGNTLQIVRLTDSDNLVWLAIYRVQQEVDGSWKIDGCKLLETTSISI